MDGLTDPGGRGAQASPSGVYPSHTAGAGHLHFLKDEEEDGFPASG